MRVIGIDPGTACCGYGIVEVNNGSTIYIKAGDIKMNSKDPLPDRLKVLYESLKAVIAEYRPLQLCIEKIFFHKSVRSAFALGAARGIAMLVAAENSLPVFEYNSTTLKLALTGYGRAEKHQVNTMVKRILNIADHDKPLSEDSSDALALCICHINSSNKLK